MRMNFSRIHPTDFGYCLDAPTFVPAGSTKKHTSNRSIPSLWVAVTAARLLGVVKSAQGSVIQ